MQNGNYYVFDWNLATGSIVISPNWLSTLGADSEGFALSSSWFRSRIHPDDLPVILIKIERHLSGLGEDDVPFSFRLKDQKSSYVEFISKGFIVLQDLEGRPDQLIWASELNEQRAS